MRPGLVAVGVGFLVLAGGALATVNLLPPPSTPQQDQLTLAPVQVAAGGSGMTSIGGTSTSSGLLAITWHSEGFVRLALYPSGACPTGVSSCVPSRAVESWSGELDAGWSIPGPQLFPYDLVWTSNATEPFTFAATAIETWNSPSNPSLWGVLVIDAVAVALGAVGAVAVFLGAFLRGGVYQGPPPVRSRSADDVEEVHPMPPRR